MEAVLLEAADMGMQWGEIRSHVMNWLNVHYPEGRESYNQGGHPIDFYGAPELLDKTTQKE